MTANAPAQRIDWVDYSKGICIILVVMMHSTLGTELALGQTGRLHDFVEWARPFRMPDFFLISGLFLARRIDIPWPSYFDKKVLHFAYFYVLWMTIQFIFKGYGIYAGQGAASLAGFYFLSFIEPFGTLWFIYLLAIFFVVTKAMRRVPALAIFAAAAVLEILPIHSGWLVIDEFASRYVYFFAGYWLAGHVFRFAGSMSQLSTPALLSALFIWAMVHTQVFVAGMAAAPGLGLVLGFVGAAAVVTAGVVLSRFPSAKALRYCGANSIVIYLAFFLFMAATRTFLVKLVPQFGPDMISIAVTAAGVVGPVILCWLTRGTKLDFLFTRPMWATLETAAKGWHSPGHDAPEIRAKPQTR